MVSTRTLVELVGPEEVYGGGSGRVDEAITSAAAIHVPYRDSVQRNISHTDTDFNEKQVWRSGAGVLV